MTKTAAMASISPFFIIRDLEETIDFYRDRLGFEIAYIGPDGDPYFVIMRRDSIQIFFKAITDEVGPIPNSQRHEWARWDAYVYTPDPDALAEDLNSRTPTRPYRAEVDSDGLMGFTVQDPNGYILYLGRPQP
jgi:catechol 2,3-dioxygenase-like lactoylglutathione lyase family enzyme